MGLQPRVHRGRIRILRMGLSAGRLAAKRRVGQRWRVGSRRGREEKRVERQVDTLRELYVELVVEEVELRGCGRLGAGAVHGLSHQPYDRTLELFLQGGIVRGDCQGSVRRLYTVAGLGVEAGCDGVAVGRRALKT